MSLLSELSPKKGSTKSKKRVGRGPGSGMGKTSARGHKGQKSRKSFNLIAGFEGGQTPLHRRLPKFGFKNPGRVNYSILNTKDLNRFDGEVTPESLRKLKLVKRGPVKILGYGKLEKSLTVKAHKFTDQAKKVIEAAGGKAEVIS
jgi:large subunit ribosomal protein L15